MILLNRRVRLADVARMLLQHPDLLDDDRAREVHRLAYPDGPATAAQEIAGTLVLDDAGRLDPYRLDTGVHLARTIRSHGGARHYLHLGEVISQ